MKVQLVNFHCILTWAASQEELDLYGFVAQIQKGTPWADLVVIRERRLNA
jgi:hypothetical protein